MQYQIKRCTAPCVKFVNREAYAEQVALAKLFLDGKSDDIIENLTTKMQEAAAQKNYEQAAILRDQIKQLREVQQQHHMEGEVVDCDILAFLVHEEHMALTVMQLRKGRMLGRQVHFARNEWQSEHKDLFWAMVSQYYVGQAKICLLYTSDAADE